MERAQIEAPVEAIAKRGKVVCSVLSKVERMAATRQTVFEITKDGVDPFELRHIVRLASGNDGLMSGNGLPNSYYKPSQFGRFT